MTISNGAAASNENLVLHHPMAMNSLVASAKRITSKQISERTGFGKPEAWQEDAWEMFDLVGEERFLATTLAGRLSQARLYVGRLSKDPIEPPEPLDTDEHVAARVFGYFGDSPYSRAQMLTRLGVNLFVAGDGWLVGIPNRLLPGYEEPDDGPPTAAAKRAATIDHATPAPGFPVLDTLDDEAAIDAESIDIEDLDWRMLSVSEVSSVRYSKRLKLSLGEDDSIEVSPDEVYLIRVWRPHPRYWWKADSPTHASLPVLRELVGLTMHISAQVDSRLAGAGVLIVPQSAKVALAVAMGLDPDSAEDPFTEALMEAMLAPISDRANASAVVPLVVTVPDEATGMFQHLKFSTPLDTEARNLRDEAIRRLALGQDAPPELLLGTGGMNHWGAWLVQEEVVTTHLEPPLALICDAITTQFLHPILIEQGMAEKEAREYVVWYDVSHLIQRPNRLADANALHDKGVISDETLRDAGGFSDSDAPPRLNEAVEIAVEMAKANPALVDNMTEIIAAFEAVLNPAEVAKDVAAEPEPSGDVTDEAGPPATQDAAPPEEEAPPLAASASAVPLETPVFTVDQILDAFLATEHGAEFIEGYLASRLNPPALDKAIDKGVEDGSIFSESSR